jgi:hypothetical protein
MIDTPISAKALAEQKKERFSDAKKMQYTSAVC